MTRTAHKYSIYNAFGQEISGKGLVSKLNGSYTSIIDEKTRNAFSKEERFYNTTKNGILFINDKYSTDLNSLLYALTFIPPEEKITLIAGGQNTDYQIKHNKDFNFYNELNRVQYFIDIGKKEGRLNELIKDLNTADISKAATPEEAIELARYYNRFKGIVLISPGHASFDRFDNKEDRSEQFEKEIKNI